MSTQQTQLQALQMQIRALKEKVCTQQKLIQILLESKQEPVIPYREKVAVSGLILN